MANKDSLQMINLVPTMRCIALIHPQVYSRINHDQYQLIPIMYYLTGGVKSRWSQKKNKS